MDYSINLYWENINRRVRFRIFHLYIFLFEHVSHCQTTKRSKMQICLTTRRFRQHNTFPIFRRVSTIGGGGACPATAQLACVFVWFTSSSKLQLRSSIQITYPVQHNCCNFHDLCVLAHITFNFFILALPTFT
jgi:hypothetical protein